ncbi:ABC transporter permease [Ancylobacter polymorphus]|uniref:ABC-type nitrate/sulfonate/bicarbonate transport system permease component n=1 Tax=Ancylobacter polymorphus TaxID=223390 RepID=A0ABU0BGE9_9HYPH|nr:ABC transporter permease [Ancylobacter polymorphus]MDQ0304866.1 ABC-type nitrate/sulfonate/bicarbonate transport system permease component [Ancylobacter polymorphus]
MSVRAIASPARPALASINEDRAVLLTRIGIMVVLLVGWEALARSGLLYRDVVPSLALIARELAFLLVDRSFYANLGVTAGEVLLAIAIGGGTGIAVGILLGRNRFLAQAYEPLLHYLGPTPKIIFFPILIMWFGVGPSSKIAMGALSCFFPVAISVAGSMREIDQVLIRVGLSLRLTPSQMFRKVYLPAMRIPVINGIRIGLGVAIVGTLLAETKLANQGLGYAIIQTYTTFNMPRMYALLIMVFLLAVGVNMAVGRYTEAQAKRRTSHD